eukprot:TRINITY_DN5832_c1_g1_i1.p1 TRINITY_DN5832_c1_g1~~TRINITY_DN5832_c1_g1_i1.p1  ORF type:complete len:205 (+),score=22.71 TRINITY_DN5832_c1_g1_i1:725-1339(+)
MDHADLIQTVRPLNIISSEEYIDALEFSARKQYMTEEELSIKKYSARLMGISLDWDINDSSNASIYGATATSLGRCIVSSNLIPKNRDLKIKVTIGHGPTNGWARVGISENMPFLQSGNGATPSNFFLQYHLFTGTVNDVSINFKRPFFTKPCTVIILHIRNGQVGLKVNHQTAATHWTIPSNDFRVHCDLFHADSHATIEQVK